jgi:hypothetical protein
MACPPPGHRRGRHGVECHHRHSYTGCVDLDQFRPYRSVEQFLISATSSGCANSCSERRPDPGRASNGSNAQAKKRALGGAAKTCPCRLALAA